MASLRADSYRRSLWGMLLATLLLCGWGGWFFLSKVAVFQSTPNARIEVNRASHPVQAVVSGRVVKSNLVLDGQVKVGDLLVELDMRSERLQLAEAQARRSALQQQLEAVRKEVAIEERVLDLAGKTKEVALKEAWARRREQEVAARFSKDQAERLERLKLGGVTPESDYLKAKALAQQDTAALRRLGMAARHQQHRLGMEQENRRAYVEKLNSAMIEIAGQANTLTATIQLLEHKIDQGRIHAPVSGRLGEINKLAPGTYVKEGEHLAAIVPEGKLTAVARFAPPDALGRIRPGQSARIRLHGFPWTQYGSVRSTVTRVASEARDGLVRVELDLHKDPRSQIPLQHGLPAEVEVEVERVSPAVLVLRAAGKLLTRPRTEAARPPAGSEGGR